MSVDLSKRADLAKIHIGKKDLGLDDNVYRQIIRDIGKANSGSAKDLSPTGRSRVIRHLKSKGWRPKRAPSKGKPRIVRNNEIMASADQIALIRNIWIRMIQAKVVKTANENSLRAWIQSTTRCYHPECAGYSALEFLPKWVAIKVTEQLKKWAGRHDVKWQ